MSNNKIFVKGKCYFFCQKKLLKDATIQMEADILSQSDVGRDTAIMCQSSKELDASSSKFFSVDFIVQNKSLRKLPCIF